MSVLRDHHQFNHVRRLRVRNKQDSERLRQ